MDSDAEMDSLEANLLNKFRSMGTTDKDVLISQFQDLLGFQLNPAGCAFFLDMTGWNLQSAIGAYYDFEGGQESSLPSMSLVSDVTVKEGESIPPNTSFVKTWRVQNTGKERWPGGCCLRFINGVKMTGETMIAMPQLASGEMTDISINLISPNVPGVHQGQWRTYTNTDTPFGDMVWVIITVLQGLYTATESQEMHAVSCDTASDNLLTNLNGHVQSNHLVLPSIDEEMGCDESETSATGLQLHSNNGFNL